jgi:hypothetical protein
MSGMTGLRILHAIVHGEKDRGDWRHCETGALKPRKKKSRRARIEQHLKSMSANFVGYSILQPPPSFSLPGSCSTASPRFPNTIVTKGKREDLPAFPFYAASYSFLAGCVWLETEPHAKLYRPRSIRLHRPGDQFAGDTAERTPISRIAQQIVRIAQYWMVEDVGEIGVELQMDALGDGEVLPDSKIHVPVHLAA